MQTFFNPTTPFLDDEGRPMVGAMVSFLDTETSGSLIEITDNAGTPLPNPLFTGMDGRLRLDNGNGAPAVPCIADGLSYKVTVARRTLVLGMHVDAEVEVRRLSIRDGGAAELFSELASTRPGWLFNRRWNLARLAVRGVDPAHERALAVLCGAGTAVYLR